MSRSRKPSHLHPVTDRRLTAYAMAATAAGVSMLAVSVAAQAEVVFTPAHITFSSGVVYIDLNNDGINDFVLSIYQVATHDRRMTASGLSRLNGVIGYASGSSYPLIALQRGYRIGPGRVFWQREAPAVNVATTSAQFISGPLPNVGVRFLGLRFNINGEAHYGWAAVNVKANIQGHRGNIQGTLLGYAYETEAGKSIFAGDAGTTKDARLSAPSPDSCTPGRLAKGMACSGRMI